MSPVNKAEFAQWLRTFKFKRYCPICRCLLWSHNCRQFNHFGVRYCFEQERPVLDERQVAAWNAFR